MMMMMMTNEKSLRSVMPVCDLRDLVNGAILRLAMVPHLSRERLDLEVRRDR